MTEISKKFAILFPGQGSQSVGMLADLAATFPIVQDTYAIASEVLGYDLWDLVQQGPVEKLNQTEYTQPALLAAEFAMWRIWQSMSPKDLPAYLAGHSLGEYSALVCAAAIDFKDAIALVAKRGQLMQQAVPEGKGAMVAIAGLDNDKILAVCKEAAQGQMLAPANYNSIGQTVLAGEREAAERTVTIAKAAGAKVAKLLPVSVPAHSELMQPAAAELTKILANIDIRDPNIAVVNNVDVAVYQDKAAVLDGLIRQLYSPVRWVELIQFLQSSGTHSFIECGPGKVLAGLNKRIIKEIPTIKFTDYIELM